MAAVCGGLVISAVPSVAGAQSPAEKKKKALALYKQGSAMFDQGKWDEAIELFEKSYEEYPAPALLYNIAQSHRMRGDCKNALFSYKRFLQVKPDASNKDAVEGYISQLEASCKGDDDGGGGDGGDDGDGGGGGGDGGGGDGGGGGGDGAGGGGAGGGGGDGAGGGGAGGGDGAAGGGDGGAGGSVDGSATVATTRATRLAATAEAGPAFLGLGGDLDVPAQLSISVGLAYPLAMGPIGLEVGGRFSFTAVPWENSAGGGETGTSSLTSVLGNAAALYPLDDKLSLTGEVGLGIQVLGGVDEPGNVFIADGMTASGALTMFNVRVGLGAEYALSNSLVVSAHPVVFSFSPAREGMRESIDQITRFEILAGLGYKM